MVATAAETTGYSTSPGEQPLVRLEGIRRHFPIFRGNVLRRRTGTVKAVDGISINIMPGETYSLVGESGCGKTTTSRMLLMADQPTEGNIYFDDRPIEPVLRSRTAKLQGLGAGRVPGSVELPEPQDARRPDRLGTADHSPKAQPVCGARPGTGTAAGGRTASVPRRAVSHEFSGGQRQRIAIARALSTRPKLIVLDEPVSALDVSIRAQILNLLKELQSTYELSYLLIAHNLATVRYMSHMVGVMYLGKIVEEAPPVELFTNAQHPYTRALISASLPAHPRQQREEIVLTGEVPSPLNPPSGCTFHPRCPFVMDRCSVDVPLLREYTPSHTTACHLFDEGGAHTC